MSAGLAGVIDSLLQLIQREIPVVTHRAVADLSMHHIALAVCPIGAQACLPHLPLDLLSATPVVPMPVSFEGFIVLLRIPVIPGIVVVHEYRHVTGKHVVRVQGVDGHVVRRGRVPRGRSEAIRRNHAAVRRAHLVPRIELVGALPLLVSNVPERVVLGCGQRIAVDGEIQNRWVHGRAGYRCRHGRSSAQPDRQPTRSVYWAERRIINQLLYQLIYADELPFSTNAVGLVAHLRASRLAVICGPGSPELEPMDRQKQVTPTAAVPRGDDSGGG